MSIPDEVKQLARAQKKIEACWVLRRETGMGLAEAKQIVDTIAAGGEVQLPTPAPSLPIGETREQRIRRQLDAISGTGGAGVLNEQEIGKLLEILLEDENLLALAKGTYDHCNGVLVATKKRVLFMNREIADGPSVEEFPLDQIYLVHHKARQLSPSVNKLMSAFGITPVWGNLPVTSSIKFFMSDYQRAEFTNMEEDAARSFAKALTGHVRYRRDEYGKLGPWDELEQLEALYDNGVISGQEFADGKRKIEDQIQQQGGRHSKGKEKKTKYPLSDE